MKLSDQQWTAAWEASDFSSWVIPYKERIRLAKRAAANARLQAWSFLLLNGLNAIGMGAVMLCLGIAEHGTQWALPFVLVGVVDAVLFCALFVALRLDSSLVPHAFFRVAAMTFCLLAASSGTYDLLKLVGGGHDLGLGWWIAISTNAAVSLAAIGFLLRRRLRRFQREIASRDYVSIGRGQAAALWTILDELIDRADYYRLGRPCILVWLSRHSNSVVPGIRASTGAQGEVYNLIVPRSFFILLKQNKEQARAMLAHELSHVFQKDVNLWVTTDAIFAIFVRVLLPFSLVVVLNVLAVTGNLKNTWTGLLCLFTSAPFIFHAREARRKSEYVADYFAGHMTSFSAIEKSVDWYAGDGSLLHPRRFERLKCISDRNFQSADRPSTVRAVLVVLALVFVSYIVWQS